MESLISPTADMLLWSVLVAIVAFGFWAEKNTAAGKLITGIIVAMMTAMILSNIRVIPFEAAVYDTIFKSILPVAIPLMLFRTDLVAAFRYGGKTLLAFGIGAMAIMFGAIVAAFVVPVGDITALTAGLFTATYTGGSANFAATALAAGFNDGSLLTPLIAADIVATNLQTMLLVMLPGLAMMQRFFGPAPVIETKEPVAVELEPESKSGAFKLPGLALALALALFLVYLGNVTAEYAGQPSYGIVFTTAYALLVSNFLKPVVRAMAYDFEIGLFFCFLFLVALAAGANLSTLVDYGLRFFLFAMLMLTIHTTLIILIGRIVGLDIRSVVIGSTAGVGGITSAAAIASAKGWRDLIIPGVMAGTIGNALGTFLGVLIWRLLS